MNAKMMVLVVLIVAFIGVGGYYFARKTNIIPGMPLAPSTHATPPPPQTPLDVIPSVSPFVSSVVSPTGDEKATLIAAVKAALVAEHGSASASLNVTVSKLEGNYAQGMASEQGGGGLWLAAKVNGTWKLVWDGNGTISCATVNPYNFPTTLVPECYNDATQKTVAR